MDEDLRSECGVLVGSGTRLVYIGGQGPDAMFREETHTCSKPARLVGPDGVKRCVQHDRIARGLSGKYAPAASPTTPAATEETPE